MTLSSTQIRDGEGRAMWAVDGQAPLDIPIDPLLVQESRQTTSAGSSQTMAGVLENREEAIPSGELVNEFYSIFEGYPYGGREQQAWITPIHTPSLYRSQAPDSHSFQSASYDPGQPQASQFTGSRDTPADSVTVEYEDDGDNLNRVPTADLSTGQSQSPNLPIGCANNHTLIPNTISPARIASSDVDPLLSSDPRYGEIAQVQNAFTEPSEHNPTSQATLQFSKILAFDGQGASALREAVIDKEGLVDVIDYILTSFWYREGKKEELPDRTLQGYIPKRRGSDAKDSPFSAFFSQQLPYTCLFCDDQKGRPLCRAMGHARSHFGYKIDGIHTNLNAKADRERRAKSPIYVCGYCHISVAKQNKARHERSAGHKQAVSSSNPTASTSAQQ